MASILIVDDSLFMRTILKKSIAAAEHRVIAEATNGEEAVLMYKQLKPDLVTLDITMPRMTGMEALQAILACDPNAVVVMCSAMGQQKLVGEALRLGAKDFIVKPFLAEDIAAVLNKWLNPL